MIHRYPHMLDSESALWSAWKEKYGSGWSEYDYDVHVGTGIVLDSRYPVDTQGIARSLTQKRIDVVAKRKGVIWIFEVKVQAALSALGQVAGYIDLYRSTFGYEGSIEGAIVSDRVMPDDKRVYNSFGITLFLFPDVL